MILTEIYPNYGSLAGRDLEAMAVGFEEVLNEDYLKYRLAEVRYLGEHIQQIGFHTIQPPGDHTVYIDARTTLEHIPQKQYPGHAFAE